MEGPFRPSLAVGNGVEVVVVDMVKLRRYLCSWVQEFEWIDDRLCEYHQHIPPSPMLSSIYLCSQTKEDKRTFGACIVTLSQGGGNMRMQISFPGTICHQAGNNRMVSIINQTQRQPTRKQLGLGKRRFRLSIVEVS